MPPYRLARLSEQAFHKIEALENEIGLTLVAYEPETERRDQATASTEEQAPASSAFLEPAQDPFGL